MALPFPFSQCGSVLDMIIAIITGNQSLRGGMVSTGEVLRSICMITFTPLSSAPPTSLCNLSAAFNLILGVRRKRPPSYLEIRTFISLLK